MLKAAILFQSGMILQRDKTIAVWGEAEPSALVRVQIQSMTAESAADENGKWQILCGPFHSSWNETMTICCGAEELCLENVQVGDVWLAGGQSNMEFHMCYDLEFETEKTACDGGIRLFDYPEVSYEGQIDEANYRAQYGFWRICSESELERFPAAAYYFAKAIRKKRDIPIGIIGCNWGGTPACAWMSEEAIRSCGGEVWLEDYRQATAQLDVEAYKKNFRAKRANFRQDQLADPIARIIVTGYPTDVILQKVAEAGFTDDDLAHITGPYDEKRPTALYHSMLRQIAPYGIQGVLWYQGESDDIHAELYHRMFPALIRCWRALWNEELPFLFVQLAPFAHWLACTGARYPELRAAQQWTADHVPHTGMAVITDIGCDWDIHPKEKRPVGERLALLAERYVFGEDVLCEAPAMRKIELQDSTVILHFDFAGEGLQLDGDRLGGLELYQGGYPVAFDSCSAQGDKVIVTGKDIRAGLPTEARLAWTDYYAVNLKNNAGIPARPAIVSTRKTL